MQTYNYGRPHQALGWRRPRNGPRTWAAHCPRWHEPQWRGVSYDRNCRDKPGTPHLLVTSADLSWFAHEHPERNAHGALELRMTFPAPGRYTLFHDFTPPRVGMQVVPVELTVEGTAPPLVPLVTDDRQAKTVDGVTARLTPDGPLVAGKSLSLTVSLSREGGAPITDLEPFLGAMGHLIIVSADRERFVHSHPIEHRHRPPRACPPRPSPAIVAPRRCGDGVSRGGHVGDSGGAAAGAAARVARGDHAGDGRR